MPEQVTPCPATGYQRVSVCLPVTVTPFANLGQTSVRCCGEPIVRPPGADACNGIPNGVCTFTIRQDICVRVPVEFGATTEAGETFVECMSATAEDTCANCHDPNPDLGTDPDEDDTEGGA